jgi:3-methylfumaryl-CoA hydratase
MSDPAMTQSAFSAWVGKSETMTDTLDPARSNALSAALGNVDIRVAGDELPLLHHWLYFWDVRAPSDIGPDGHPKRGGFLPPVPLPRRMWASGTLVFNAPLILGDVVTKTSTISSIEEKTGKSGPLVFVTIRHELSGTAGVAIVEDQNIVYREAAVPGSIALPNGDFSAPADVRRDFMPDSVMLFRYSALTMNGHKIHYDRPYAMNEEAYPALVVHGPLQATLLAGAAQALLGKPPAHFTFRAQTPAFDHDVLSICGAKSDDGVTLWTQQNGAQCMVGTAN